MDDWIALLGGIAFFALIGYARANPKMPVTEAARKGSRAAGALMVYVASLAMGGAVLYGIIWLVHQAWRHS